MGRLGSDRSLLPDVSKAVSWCDEQWTNSDYVSVFPIEVARLYAGQRETIQSQIGEIFCQTLARTVTSKPQSKTDQEVPMKAVVFHGIGDIRLEEVKEPKTKETTDAIVALTASAICGTDLHMVRGTLPGMQKGTILGHEGVGVIEETGKGVRNLSLGDRVVVPSTIGCGNCSYCRAGYYAQCDKANPNGPGAGTAFFGGPKSTGPSNTSSLPRPRQVQDPRRGCSPRARRREPRPPVGSPKCSAGSTRGPRTRRTSRRRAGTGR